MSTAVMRRSAHRIAALVAGAGVLAAVGLSGARPAGADTPPRADGVSITVTVPVVGGGIGVTTEPGDDGVAGWD